MHVNWFMCFLQNVDVESLHVDPWTSTISFPQHPVILNVPSQLQGTVQTQPQAQPFFIQQQQQNLIPQTNLVNSNFGNALAINQSPRSDELRSYLSRSQTRTTSSQNCSTTNSVASPPYTIAASAVSSSNCVAVANTSHTQSQAHQQVNYSTFQQVSACKPTEHVHETLTPVTTVQYETLSRVSAGQHSIASSPPTPEQVKQQVQSQHEPKVSSPGLAFLAQVSSLTSGNRPMPSHLYASARVEDYISHHGM